MPDWERVGKGLEGESVDPQRGSGDNVGEKRDAPELGPELLRTLVQGSEEGMILVDVEGRIVFANPASGRLLGAPHEDLVGRMGREFCRPEHLFMAREVFARSLAAPGEPLQLTVDVKTADGGLLTLDVKVVNHLASPGIRAVVGHLREATSTAGELGESYKALFENALVGLGVADMQGNLLAFNDAMLTPGGYTREDIRRIGNVAKLYAYDADRPRVLQILRSKGYVWRERVPFVRKDGSPYDTLLTLTPVVFLGQPCLYATVEVVDEDGGPGPMKA